MKDEKEKKYDFDFDLEEFLAELGIKDTKISEEEVVEESEEEVVEESEEEVVEKSEEEVVEESEEEVEEEPEEEVEEEPEEEAHEVVRIRKAKKGTWQRVVALVLALAMAYIIGAVTHHKKNEELPSKAETVITAPVSEEDIYGFVDAADDDQVMLRAAEYYTKYICANGKSEAGARDITADVLANDIRLMNGEFYKDAEGNISYNDTDIIEVANDIHTIANYDSFKQYGTDIFFTPMAPLFIDGSLAQKGAQDLDEQMEKVVAAIRANDDAAFLEAAKAWGTVVINMCEYVDFTGEYVSIRQVDPESAFFLYHVLSSKYASTILEYSESHDLDVCIEYCIDYNTGEVKEESLSQIMYNINERAIDAVAVRSGNLEEYEANNMSLPEDLFMLNKDYYNSKKDVEIGCSQSLN